MGKLTIQDIAAILVEKNGFDKKEAKQFASVMFALIQERLETDQLVKVKGLGTFKIIDVEARESVSIRTGERVVINGHSKVTFTPDATMKELVNKPFSQFDTVVLNDGVEFEDLKDEMLDIAPVRSGKKPKAKLVVEDRPVEEELPKPVNSLETNQSKEVLQQEDESQETVETQQEDGPQETVEAQQEDESQETVEAQQEDESQETVEAQQEDESQDLVETQQEDESQETVEAQQVNEPEEPVELQVGEVPQDDSQDDAEPVLVTARPLMEFVYEEPLEEPDATNETPTEDTSAPIEPQFVNHESESFSRVLSNDDLTGKPEKKPQWKWWILLVVLALLILSSLGGYYYGTLQQSEENVVYLDSLEYNSVDTVATQVVADTVEVQDTVLNHDLAIVQMTNPSSKAETKTETKKQEVLSQARREEPKAEPIDQYAQKDERVRLGAYRIVGLDHEVKVLAGQTFYSICRAHLGPKMECYVEVFNDLPRDPKIKEGQIIKIPKLKLKKRGK